MPAPVATMKARNKSVAMTMFSILFKKIHRGLTGHSGPGNAGFSREALSLVRAATFLLLHDRLELPAGIRQRDCLVRRALRQKYVSALAGGSRCCARRACG